MPLSNENRIWPTRKVAANSTIQDVLEVSMFNLCLAENGLKFHTDRYELMSDLRPSGKPAQLVVRRGAPFNVKLQCSRSYDPSVDTMMMILALDPYGSENITFGNGTEVNMVVEMAGSGNSPVYTEPESEAVPDLGWSAAITGSTKEADGTVTITLAITTPAQASVGKYNLGVFCRLDTKDTKSSFKFPLPLYLLFNPWCEQDAVYLKDEAARQEYVLKDNTMVWKQTPASSGMTSWNLGQYEQDILDCSLFVIAVPGRVPATYRGNPVRVVRALSGALNINNGPGVLEGRWNGDYADGVAPQAWSGSVKILQQFYREGMQPVRYGQCWVFAGIFATVCRAVGIPNRMVTNFNSAHDSEASLTLDFFVDSSGGTDGSMSSDSMWNYHVWNEVWMTRPDLGAGLYDGWQVVDATPQELSDGMFKLGPTSVRAVKNGEVNLAYDTEFVFAEVNADRTYWVTRGDNSVPKLLEISTDYIGQDISTKVVGKNEREDLTSAYKHREGTPEERQVMASAQRLGSQRFSSNAVVKMLLVPHYENARANASSEWVKLELKTYKEHRLGEPFDIELSITNTLAGQTVQVVGTLWLKHTDYTGKRSEDIQKITIDQTIQAVSSVPIKVSIPFAEYNNPAFDQSHIKALCVVEVPGTDQTFFSQQMFNLATPDISMDLVEDPSSKGGYTVQGSFKNPLPIQLSAGRFLIEGSSLTKPSEQTYDSVPVGGNASFVYRLNMAYKGPSVVCARFSSNELKNVHGHLEFDLSKL
ncbi:annulin-like [Anopheles ziemanni]|uniref:annulin-like n=1 Tax=Anopheles coustani TaxID=139045 RepID=UPI00265B1EF6|nr:annulin-like [Anopheles coustani]XP_058177074.1 annulin-like [Anopheles ziemanni]